MLVGILSVLLVFATVQLAVVRAAVVDISSPHLDAASLLTERQQTGCSIIAKSPPPTGFTCGATGSLSHPSIIDRPAVADLAACQAACFASYQCKVYSYGPAQSPRCTRYDRTAWGSGFRAGNTGVRFYNKQCFKQSCPGCLTNVKNSGFDIRRSTIAPWNFTALPLVEGEAANTKLTVVNDDPSDAYSKPNYIEVTNPDPADSSYLVFSISQGIVLCPSNVYIASVRFASACPTKLGSDQCVCDLDFCYYGTFPNDGSPSYDCTGQSQNGLTTNGKITTQSFNFTINPSMIDSPRVSFGTYFNTPSPSRPGCQREYLRIDDFSLVAIPPGEPCDNYGSINCDGVCTYIPRDSDNCGSCGNVCASGQSCTNGVCG